MSKIDLKERIFLGIVESIDDMSEIKKDHAKCRLDKFCASS